MRTALSLPRPSALLVAVICSCISTCVCSVSRSLAASESCLVVAVTAPDHVVVNYLGLPVAVPLTGIDVPGDDAARKACQQRLAALVAGKHVSLEWRPAFGRDADGSACVELSVAGDNVNVALVAGGFARYRGGEHPDPGLAAAMKKAEDKARSGQKGVWAAPAPAPAAAVADASPAPVPETTAAPAPTTPAAVAPSSPPGPFCAEIDSTYYYPSGSPDLANINPQRLIYYADESAAQRAGKQPSPTASAADISSDGSEASADAIYAKGHDIYAEAIAAGNTSRRDQLYAQAFVVLTKAMQVYSKLCEAKPDDEALGEKLRQCMQLRYGSVKQRRFE